MYPKRLCLTAAAVASLVAISACNKSATPTAPANSAASLPPATTPSPSAATPAPMVSTPAPAVATPGAPAVAPAPMATENGGRGMGRGGGGGMGGGRGKVRAACAADIARFCTQGQKPRQCLKPHEAELSPACQAARAAQKAARQARKGAAGGAAGNE